MISLKGKSDRLRALGRVPAAEVLINTAAVADNIRDLSKQLNIPDLIKEGSVAYGMQSFDQSLMQLYTRKLITYEEALRQSSNPDDFALKVSGISSTSDASWDEFTTDQDGNGEGEKLEIEKF